MIRNEETVIVLRL